MTTWTADELTAIGDADELRIAPRRDDGTLHKAVPIWVVRDGDDLYVRSFRGQGAAWYRNAEASHEGHIQAGGVDTDVSFADVDGAVHDRIDEAYRTKYARYDRAYIDPMVTATAREATFRLVPRRP